MSAQLEVLSLSKGVYYYKPKPESDANLSIMRTIDLENTEHPTKGVIGMVDHLLLLGFAVGPKRVLRLMRNMCITAIYPRSSLSKGGVAKFRMPYLLRGLGITRPNQVWSIDITLCPNGSRIHVSDGHHRRVQPLHRRVGTAQHAGQGEQR